MLKYKQMKAEFQQSQEDEQVKVAQDYHDEMIALQDQSRLREEQEAFLRKS